MRFLTLTLAALSLAGCSFQPRFIHTGGDLNPFVMFDNKTAQNCYAGSREALENHIQAIQRQADADAPLDKPSAVASYYFPKNSGVLPVSLSVELTRQSLEFSKKAAEEYRELELLTGLQKLPTCRGLIDSDNQVPGKQ